MKKLNILKIVIACCLFTFQLFPQLNLQNYFKECGFEGSITIYDKKNDRWIFSDSVDANIELLPASSSKIINSMILLETGVLKDENEIVKWDRIKRWVDDWNQDLNLKQAFKFSAAWVYSKKALEVGREKYAHFLNECNYGNKVIGDRVDQFWLDGSLKISPVQQINFLRGLDEEKFKFSKRTYRIVKEIMIESKTEEYILRSKTGWGKIEGSDDTGWWVGYITLKDNVIYFATRLRKGYHDENPNFPGCRKTITKEILKDLGIVSIP